MAIEGARISVPGVTAGVDLSAAQFKAVKITGADFAVNLASTGGEAILGILQNKPISGQAADVTAYGVTKALAGASYSRGALLMTDTSARLITATSTNVAVAIALEAAGAANEIRSVTLINAGKQ